jgi:hypothetical protein
MSSFPSDLDIEGGALRTKGIEAFANTKRWLVGVYSLVRAA